MLVVDPDVRITAAEALDHAWIKSANIDTAIGNATLD